MRHSHVMTLYIIDLLRIASTINKYIVCHNLNKYGCNPTTIPNVVRNYIESRIAGYTLPTNPCSFDTINSTWIFSQISVSAIHQLGTNDIRNTPCQVLVPIPNAMANRGLPYLIDETYWFGDNNTNNGGQCDVINTNNNPYSVTICDYYIPTPLPTDHPTTTTPPSSSPTANPTTTYSAIFSCFVLCILYIKAL